MKCVSSWNFRMRQDFSFHASSESPASSIAFLARESGPSATSVATAYILRGLAQKVSTSQGSSDSWTSRYMKSAPAMSPVVASDHSDMKRRSSRKASMMRMVRPIWRLLKLVAAMAPAETPQTLSKS